MTEENQQPNKENKEFEECKKQAEEYLNNWKRERADFVNYKKDEAKRMEEFLKFANEAVLMEVVEMIDDLERATKEMKNEGLNQVLIKFQSSLQKYGLERIEVKGAFDPLVHEVVGGSEGDKLEEIRAGYTMHGKVIRPARVKIIK